MNPPSSPRRARAPHLLLPPLTAEQVDAVLRVLAALEETIWVAYESQLIELGLREALDDPPDQDPNPGSDDIPW